MTLKQIKMIENTSEEKKLHELRSALIEGENSLKVDNFDADKHLADIHRKYLRSINKKPPTRLLS